MRLSRLFALLVFLTPAPSGAQRPAAPTPEIDLEPTQWRVPVWLGLRLKTAIDEQGGVEVKQLYRRSPADDTGVAVGDRIRTIDGVRVASVTEVDKALEDRRHGDQVRVTVLRKNEQKELTFELEVMPENLDRAVKHTVGFPAPQFRFTSTDGTSRSLQDLRGKVTVIEFWSTRCTPCDEVHDQLNVLTEKYGERVNIIGLSDETRDIVIKAPMAKSSKVEIGIVDNEVVKDYAVFGIPMVFLLDPDHQVTKILYGRDEIVADLAADLEKLTAQAR